MTVSVLNRNNLKSLDITFKIVTTLKFKYKKYINKITGIIFEQ